MTNRRPRARLAGARGSRVCALRGQNSILRVLFPAFDLAFSSRSTRRFPNLHLAPSQSPCPALAPALHVFLQHLHGRVVDIKSLKTCNSPRLPTPRAAPAPGLSCPAAPESSRISRFRRATPSNSFEGEKHQKLRMAESRCFASSFSIDFPEESLCPSDKSSRVPVFSTVGANALQSRAIPHGPGSDPPENCMPLMQHPAITRSAIFRRKRPRPQPGARPLMATSARASSGEKGRTDAGGRMVSHPRCAHGQAQFVLRYARGFQKKLGPVQRCSAFGATKPPPSWWRSRHPRSAKKSVPKKQKNCLPRILAKALISSFLGVGEPPWPQSASCVSASGHGIPPAPQAMPRSGSVPHKRAISWASVAPPNRRGRMRTTRAGDIVRPASRAGWPAWRITRSLFFLLCREDTILTPLIRSAPARPPQRLGVDRPFSPVPPIAASEKFLPRCRLFDWTPKATPAPRGVSPSFSPAEGQFPAYQSRSYAMPAARPQTAPREGKLLERRVRRRRGLLQSRTQHHQVHEQEQTKVHGPRRAALPPNLCSKLRIFSNRPGSHRCSNRMTLEKGNVSTASKGFPVFCPPPNRRPRASLGAPVPSSRRGVRNDRRPPPTVSVFLAAIRLFPPRPLAFFNPPAQHASAVSSAPAVWHPHGLVRFAHGV